MLTITALNHIIRMVIYPTQERDDDVVDPEHRDDDFEDVGQEVKPFASLVSSPTDDSKPETVTEHIG